MFTLFSVRDLRHVRRQVSTWTYYFSLPYVRNIEIIYVKIILNTESSNLNTQIFCIKIPYLTKILLFVRLKTIIYTVITLFWKKKRKPQYLFLCLLFLNRPLGPYRVTRGLTSSVHLHPGINTSELQDLSSFLRSKFHNFFTERKESVITTVSQKWLCKSLKSLPKWHYGFLVFEILKNEKTGGKDQGHGWKYKD